MKVCTICKENKSLSLFSKSKTCNDGFLHQCKECKNNIRKQNYILNKDKFNKSRRVSYTKDKIRIQNENKKYREKNKVELSIKSKIYSDKNKTVIANYQKEYRAKNKDKLALEKKLWQKNKAKSDNVYVLKRRLRWLVYNYLNKGGYIKKSKTKDIIGCDYEFFREYIESQFKKGMTWNNIHLDHIKPLSIAKTEQEVLELNHYTNFQPLFIKDNLVKSNKLIEKQLRIL